MKILIEKYGLIYAEAEVAVLIADGLSNDDIAKRRDCSVNTTKTQLGSILRKLACARRDDVINFVCDL